jgi:hypothetical protein
MNVTAARTNLPQMPGVFPDYPASVVRNAGAGACHRDRARLA